MQCRRRPGHPRKQGTESRSRVHSRPASRSQLLTRILAVEDFEPYRLFIVSLLQERSHLRVICEASGGLQAVEKAQELKSDLILMDIGLPELNGIEAARQIRMLTPNVKIVFLTQGTSQEIVQEAMRLGACGYVFKSEAESDLLTAVEAVLEGKQFISGGEMPGTT